MAYRLVGIFDVKGARRKHAKRLRKMAVMALFVLLASPIAAQAQEVSHRVSLEEVINLALTNHPRMMVATMDVERHRAAKGEVWDGGSTEVSYSWGQLNSDFRKDHELSVVQPLGSPITPFYKNTYPLATACAV